jgi:uncharacterized protein YkwD
MNSDKMIDDVFTLINQVRSDPQEYVHRFGDLLNHYQGKIYKDRIKTREGELALRDLLNDLRGRQGIDRKLQWCFGLHMIADQQARRLAQYDLVTTEGHSCHQPLTARIKDFAIVKGRISEVTDFGGESGQEVIEWLLIDDGLTSRKRRLTLLDPEFKFIGIGSYMHETHGVVTVIILAEDVVSLAAPGKDGYFMKRQPLRPEEISKLVVHTVRQN